MNAGKTPGYLLKKINKALCSAFLDEDELEMMVLYELNISLKEVASGKNLKQIVHSLLTYCDAHNKLGNLLDGALNQNSGNNELKQLYSEEFKIPPSLITILFPLEDNIIKPMQQAYKTCCPDDYFNYYEEYEIPKSFSGIIKKLEDIPQPPTDDEKRIVKFVARLLDTGDIPEPTAKKLKQWLTKNANNPSDLLAQTSSHYQNHQQPKLDEQPYLLVKVDSSKQYHQQHQPSYLVSAWFIPDLSNYDYLRNHQHCKFLETPSADGESEQDVFSLEDLPKLIEFFLDQLIKYSREYDDKLRIVFFLPYALLNYKIERIEIKENNQSIPIGSEYCVIFRSIGRLKNYKHQGKWLRKWRQFQNQRQTICLANFAFSNFEDWPELYSHLEQINAIGVKLNHPPCEEKLKAIDRAAIPVTLWLRQNNFTTINCQQALDQLLNCQINQLPEKVKQQRLQAFPKAKNKQEHIGHHLALLWEDPYLLPPQINYTPL
ncbi:MAG: hypothetical protein F6J90_12810 [Moorea sp. SIOASIH]|uniref:VMAP-C domain-containing protein n=1 Tax=Moorena sp. SIOASIH TaxID=2607817 RepID=UPI0013B6D0A6|nr:effector-associated domain EAD1-containing protein [Moorena sp. SIOASIH]NEO37148.1 hypothetical protein [Moorena sp. SIOASIH]